MGSPEGPLTRSFMSQICWEIEATIAMTKDPCASAEKCIRSFFVRHLGWRGLRLAEWPTPYPSARLLRADRQRSRLGLAPVMKWGALLQPRAAVRRQRSRSAVRAQPSPGDEAN